ncbi:MAG: dTDP-4-dehydrorhamnose 3,5-epimerase family protein [Clostridiales bacterium]|nr:dTDP-4-dehydrorhamnose 3,5-epimerase family protein [Clostridiales bacterium]
MKIVKTYFEKVYLLELDEKDSVRGSVRGVFHEKDLEELGISFHVEELRSYAMPKPGTFFGIHYQGDENPMDRIVTVIQGSGEDYVIDLRPDSATYLQYVQNTLTGENKYAVYIPHGFGHAFYSTGENVIQIFATNAYIGKGFSKQLNYREEKIGLVLPGPISAIAEYDENAPYLDS